MEWMMRCNRRGNKWNPDTSYICSEHFTPIDLNEEEPGGSKQGASLKPWAVPSRNLPVLTLPVCLLERMDSEDLNEIIMKNQVKIGDLTVDELKVELKKRKIAQVGPKVALVKRLRKFLSDQGEDADTYIFNKEGDATDHVVVSDTESENPKTEATKSDENESPKAKADSKKEEKETKKTVEDVDTPKRTLRRSTRERSPAIQNTPTTPLKTPRAAKGKLANKLATVAEDDPSNKVKKEESESELKPEETTVKKSVKKEVGKKETKKVEEEEPKKEFEQEVKKEKEIQKECDKETSEESQLEEAGGKNNEEKNQENSKEENTTVNGEVEEGQGKSPEKKEMKKESDVKKTGKKSIDKEKVEGDEKELCKEEMEIVDEDVRQAELDLELDDMEQPDYEDELNFDCGSTFISDNDGDLDDAQEDSKTKESPSKKMRKSGGEIKKDETQASTDAKVSEKSDGNEDTEEDKEKIKSSDKNVSEKEDTRSTEKGNDSKGDPAPKDLWVTGLSSATKAADLKQAFLKHGKVISTKIVMNPKMPGSQCFGIVTVAAQEDALACVKALNVTELLGRFITVKIISKKKDKDKKDDGTKRRKEDDGTKSDEKKEGSSPKKEPKDISKLSEEKERREREFRREREVGIRKRLGGHRGPMRRSPPTFMKRRPDFRQQEMVRRREIMERKRAIDRRLTEEVHRQEAMRLNREREMLRLERERIEREKVELLRLERERLEREKEEIRKQHLRLEEDRRKREFGGPREDYDSRPKRAMNNRHFSDRRPSPNYGGGPPPYRDKEIREKKKMRQIQHFHVKKTKEDIKRVAPASMTPFVVSEKKHKRRSRSGSSGKETWRLKENRHKQEVYVDEKKMREMQQIEKLIQMKQKIKNELRLSCREKEEESLPKRRKHSSPPSKTSPPRHHFSNHSHPTDHFLTEKSKQCLSPPTHYDHSFVNSSTSKHRLLNMLCS